MGASNDREFFASCLAGLEPFLADELHGLGVRRTRALSGGVSFFATGETALRACLWSRLASRITLVVDRVPADDADALYEGVCAIGWERYIRRSATLAVHARGSNDQLRNTTFTALKVKDAVVDSLRASWGARPDVDPEDPDVRIDVSVRARKATISLDLVGESLYRRTYLEDEAKGPLSHAVALSSALLALCGWDASCSKGGTLLDPQCADGVLVCEAALAAADAAPGLARAAWGFEGLSLFEDETWDDLLAEADERLDAGLEALGASASKRIVGAVGSQRRLAAARKRLARAGAASAVELVLADEEGSVASDAAAALSRRHPLTIASALPFPEDFATAANAKAAYSAFARCVGAAPDDAVVAVSGGDATIDAAFQGEPARVVQLGHGRIAQEARLFKGQVAQSHTIVIPDSVGGAGHVVAVMDEHADQFAARLRKNLRERRKWAARNAISCYRIYDADLPDFSVAIDVYEGEHEGVQGRFLHIAEYAPPASVDEARARRRFGDVLTIAPVVCETLPAYTFSKVRRRDKGGRQYRQDERLPFVVKTRENGLSFEVDLNGYLDTGLFLDHRSTRALVGSLAHDARFLNLFAYTGTATVHATAGGARSTCTVDLSQTYLDWARRNMSANGFDGGAHAFVKADVMTWITEARRSGKRFDLIFVDPPTFSNSKSMGKRTWDVQRDHVELLIGVSRLLSERGVAVFSCNLRSFKPDSAQLERYGVVLEDITAKTIPHDFERNPKIHHCYLVRRA